jgi:hypothetical protein
VIPALVLSETIIIMKSTDSGYKIDKFFTLIAELKGVALWDEQYLLAKLSEILNSESYWIRKYVIEAIISFDDEKLIRAFNKSKFSTIYFVTEALGNSSDERTIRPLLILTHTTNDWKIHDLATKAIIKLTSLLPEEDNSENNIVRIQPPISDRILEIKQTKQSPFVYFDIEKGILLICGRIADDSDKIIEIFKSVSDELDLCYNRYPDKLLVAEFCIEFFRTGCGKMILDFFKRLEKRMNTTVFWYYLAGDEDMLESGEDFESIIRVPFCLKEIPAHEDFYFDFTEIKYQKY